MIIRVLMHSDTILETPLGYLRIQCSSEALVGLSYYDKYPMLILKPEENELSREVRKQLTSYFDLKIRSFNIPVDPPGTVFEKKIWDRVAQIPFGETINYGEIAAALNIKNGGRAVGQANSRNPIPIIIPCHRVIGKDGNLTGYAGGIWRKKWLLEHEGSIRQTRLSF